MSFQSLHGWEQRVAVCGMSHSKRGQMFFHIGKGKGTVLGEVGSDMVLWGCRLSKSLAEKEGILLTHLKPVCCFTKADTDTVLVFGNPQNLDILHFLILKR